MTTETIRTEAEDGGRDFVELREDVSGSPLWNREIGRAHV
jgi:hypothetical protein